MIRFVVACLLEGLTFQLAGQITLAPADVTVILDFKGSHSTVAAEEMKREAGLILAPSGIKLAWAPLNEATGDYKDLVVMTFRGSCEFEVVPAAHSESEPFASTTMVDGDVLPFGEVNCGKVVRSVRTAMSADDWEQADRLVGRALGRVVAHELVHMLTKSAEHSHEGIEKPALSGRQLIEPSLTLSAVDLDRLREAIAGRVASLKKPTQPSVAATER